LGEHESFRGISLEPAAWNLKIEKSQNFADAKYTKEMKNWENVNLSEKFHLDQLLGT